MEHNEEELSAVEYLRRRWKRQAEEHEYKLKNDPKYRAKFLKETSIPNASGALAKKLREMYALHNREGELPEMSELVRIINQAHKDTEESERTRNPWHGRCKDDFKVTDAPYYVFESNIINYFSEMKHCKPMTEDEAWETVRQNSRLDRLLLPTKTLIAVLTMSLPKSLPYVPAIPLCLPITLALGIKNALTPEASLVKEYMEWEEYCESSEGKRHFKEIRSQINEVLNYYAEKKDKAAGII